VRSWASSAGGHGRPKSGILKLTGVLWGENINGFRPLSLQAQGRGNELLSLPPPFRAQAVVILKGEGGGCCPISPNQWQGWPPVPAWKKAMDQTFVHVVWK